jgi:hypothetical protein
MCINYFTDPKPTLDWGDWEGDCEIRRDAAGDKESMRKGEKE